MKKIFTIFLLLISIISKSQDTFSIVAVDSITGEVGSAGASCVPITLPTAPHGVLIICDVIPGTGAINTQAYWLAANQATAHSRMLAGDSAQAIIEWVTGHDSQNDSSIRQYGVVELNGGHPRSAGFTGANCMNYKNHITGPGYSIQGNILLGPQILDSMETRFLNTAGTLSDRLMAALQGANVVGADTRCAPSGLSSLSSYLRVAKPGDTTGTYSVDLYMAYPNSTNWALDPIDSLQSLYNDWLLTNVYESTNGSTGIQVTQNEDEFIFDFSRPRSGKFKLELFNVQGKRIFDANFVSTPIKVSKNEMNAGSEIIFYNLSDEHSMFAKGKIVKIGL
jgi:uncharacterized Ntn-hydrolase superfamily protein